MKLGAFSLQSRVGEGGMGEVWRGRHEEAMVDVAVKVMLPSVMDDPEYRKAFETEVRSVASLDHPNIVTILDFGLIKASEARESENLIEGSPYLVMEYARGGAVGDYFQKILWPDLRELLLLILDALAHAHAREVVHRDLKPENILVGCGSSWDVKLTDFGLAHASDRFTKSGNIETAWGTPQYMAPEQLRGLWREYGPWTDLYALGCMAFELISGTWPYDAPSVFEIGQAHIQNPIPRLTPRFQIPDGVEDWIRKLMAKRRRDRFQHAADAAYLLAQLPALDHIQRFGVLFTPPGSFRDRISESQEVQEGVSTQLMPELRGLGSSTPTMAGDVPNTGELRRTLSGRIPNEAHIRAVVPPFPTTWQGRGEGTISNELMGISLGLFGLRATPLVDREEERDLMWSLLKEVREKKEARLLLVQGSAGTGKSELVRWLTRRAREVGGATVLSAFHSPIVGPADGLIPMMERFLKCVRIERKDLESHLSKVLIDDGLAGDFDIRALVALFDNDDASDEGTDKVQHLSREERYAIIYRYLSLLASRRPILIWLDDVQWGLDAIGLATYIQEAQKTQRAPIFVIMTARTEALNDRPSAQAALATVMKSLQARHCGVPPLSAEDTETLVRQLLRLDEVLASHILKRSQGVPLFAVQLVEDWVARGKLVMGEQGFELKSGADIAIPDGLHELWESRISGFVSKKAPETLHYLELASALGQEVDHLEWARAQAKAGLPTIAGLEERLAEENLARLRDGSWQFSHGLMQESLERQSREAGRWQRWNRACAEAIGELRDMDDLGVPERLAWHLVESGAPSEALSPLTAAIEQCIERSDYTHALDLITWREELIDALDEARWKILSRVDKARVMARMGDYQGSVEVGEPLAREAFEAGEIEVGMQALVWAGKGRRALGALDLAQKHLHQARQHFAKSGLNAWEARAVLELGRVEEQRGDFEQALLYCQEGYQLFSALDDAFGAAQCLNAVGDMARQSQDFDGAHQASLAALDLYKKLGNISGIADCLNDLAESCRMQGDLVQAREFAEEAIRLYSAVGSAEEYFVRLNLAMIALEEKRYEVAAEAFRELLAVFQTAGQEGLRAQAAAGLLAAAAGCGDWSQWPELLAGIYRTFERTGVRAPLAMRALSLAAALADQANETGLALQARQIERTQTESIRQTQPLAEPLGEE